jgi:spermidine synthase
VSRQSGGPVAAILLLTGAAGLIYQVAWQRYLGILTGVDHAATAATLAVFLGGLSLGYALCGDLSSRSSRPLATYAWLEAAIGLWGLAFPWTFSATESVARGWSFSPPYGVIAGSLGAAVPLILVPALLMGATVPFMTRGLALSRSGLTATHARVYGLNTLGAVAGALGAGFVILPAWGPGGAVRLAAALNLAAAAILLAWPRTHVALDTTPSTPDDPPAPARFAMPTLAVLSLLGGAVTMVQENALIRLLGLVVGGTPFVFALIVAAFVAAIAAGSLVVARLREIPPRAVYLACAGSAAAWLVLFPTYDTWPWLAHAMRFALGGHGLGFGAYYALVGLVLASAIFLAVAPMGAVLPLLFHERRASVPGSGRVSGHLLAWSALGSLVGSVGGGILLFHVINLPRVLLVAPLLAAGMAWLAAPAAGRAARPVALALIVLTIGAFVGHPGFDPQRLAMGTYRMRAVTPDTFSGPGAFQEVRMINRNLIHQEDGPLDSVAVLEVPAWDLPMARPLEIYINGKSDSNTLSDRDTLRLSAHLPMLFAAEGRRALVIGQGTGVTLGELALWPELATLDLVEVSPSVARTLPLFRAHTRDVGADPRLRVHVQDARFFLRRPGEPWDVIVSEPSNLWVGGNDLLFTDEFLRSIEARLAPDGVLLQWAHLYETDAQALCSVVGTMASVFPDLTAFRGTKHDWLIVASRGLPEGAVGRARARWASHPEMRASLAELGIADFDALWARRIPTFPDYAARARRECPIHTTLDTRLGYRAARAMFEGTTLEENDVLGGGQE